MQYAFATYRLRECSLLSPYRGMGRGFPWVPETPIQNQYTA